MVGNNLRRRIVQIGYQRCQVNICANGQSIQLHEYPACSTYSSTLRWRERTCFLRQHRGCYSALQPHLYRSTWLLSPWGVCFSPLRKREMFGQENIEIRILYLFREQKALLQWLNAPGWWIASVWLSIVKRVDVAEVASAQGNASFRAPVPRSSSVS